MVVERQPSLADPAVHRSRGMVDEARHIQHTRVGCRQFDWWKTCICQRPSAPNRAPLPMELRLDPFRKRVDISRQRILHHAQRVLRHGDFLDGVVTTFYRRVTLSAVSAFRESTHKPSCFVVRIPSLWRTEKDGGRNRTLASAR